MRQKSAHQIRVENFMRQASQEVPKVVQVPSEDVRRLRAKLILEEALETISGLGFRLVIDPYVRKEDGSSSWGLEINSEPNLVEVIDGCCDIKVVTTGTLSAFGVPDILPQAEVDVANLRKFGPGSYRRDDGKWIKPPDWVGPNWYEIIRNLE